MPAMQAKLHVNQYNCTNCTNLLLKIRIFKTSLCAVTIQQLIIKILEVLQQKKPYLCQGELTMDSQEGSERDVIKQNVVCSEAVLTSVLKGIHVSHVARGDEKTA